MSLRVWISISTFGFYPDKTRESFTFYLNLRIKGK